MTLKHFVDAAGDAMPAQIKQLQALKRAGILKDITPKEAIPEFRQVNLIYGFNGSGKSTLSRIFASLQAGEVDQKLPDGCTFTFVMDDQKEYKAPDALSGLEKRVCVFNRDFIERNLHWADGTANSIFYISEEQADAAKELRAAEESLPGLEARREKARAVLKERNNTLATYKRERAKAVGARLHLGVGRKYEAPQLQKDYEETPFQETDAILPEALNALEDVAKQTSPPPPVVRIQCPEGTLDDLVQSARHFAETSIGRVTIEELDRHPAMVNWAKHGHEYHSQHRLGECLFCGQTIPADRRAQLAAAFDESLARSIDAISAGQRQAEQFINTFVVATDRRPQSRDLVAEQRVAFEEASKALSQTIRDLGVVFDEIERVYRERLARPTVAVAHNLPSPEKTAGLAEVLAQRVTACNLAIDQHNEATKHFAKLQEQARAAIKRHFLADGSREYHQHKQAVENATDAESAAEEAFVGQLAQIEAIQAKVRSHGPAAEKISKLVKAYLGHGELAIVAAPEGYELHRHGKLVSGEPSEGEKTAIALCYFLTTLDADGRVIGDLIVVVDDPISSLDTKAMNYACALIRKRLNKSAQLFVLTHNQHCMNEFRKEWKGRADPKNKNTAPTAALFFLDVKVPADSENRVTSLVTLPHLLREYDSE